MQHCMGKLARQRLLLVFDTIQGYANKITFPVPIHSKEIISNRHKISSAHFSKLKDHLFESISPGFAEHLFLNEILVVGDYFGYGSVREQPVLALKQAGIKIVIAKSFSSLFYMNAFNNGLLCLMCNTDLIQDNDFLAIDLNNKVIRNVTTNRGIKVKETNPFLLELYRNKGMIRYIKTHEQSIEPRSEHGIKNR